MNRTIFLNFPENKSLRVSAYAGFRCLGSSKGCGSPGNSLQKNMMYILLGERFEGVYFSLFPVAKVLIIDKSV